MKNLFHLTGRVTNTSNLCFHLLCIFGLLSVLLLIAGCISFGSLANAIRDTNVELRNAVDSFDRAIDALSQQSSDWQVVLQDLERTLVSDVQSSIRVEITNLMQTGIFAVGGEFRCNVEYLRVRTERELRRIRNDLAEAINRAGIDPPLPLLPEIAAEPYICGATPPAVDMSLEQNRRSILNLYGFDLRSMPITAELVSLSSRRNISSSLAVISDLQMVLDLTSMASEPDENARQIVFSWDNEAQCVVPVLTPSVTINCSTAGTPVSGNPQSFYPPHTNGDEEYGGCGPCVRFTLNLAIDAERTKISANYFMHAYECSDDFNKPHSDYTAVYGSGSIELFRVSSPNQRIVGHNLASSTNFSYIDDDIQDDLFTFAGTNPVEKLIFVGDTQNNDTGETGVTIYFRHMVVQVETCH